MGHKIVNLANTAIRGAIYGAKVEGKFWQQFWKHPYDKLIRGSIVAGGAASGNLKNNETLLDDSALSQIKNGSQAYKQNKTRSRFKRYSSGRCRPIKYTSRKRYRHSNTCRH